MIFVLMASEKEVLTMAEYIEREALMRRIKEIHCAECDSYHGVRCRACWVDDTLDYIDSEPAADVVEVVRCKDCKYFGLNDENVPYCINPFGLDDPEPNGFCNYGIGKNRIK